MAVSEVVYEPTKRLAVRRCQDCPFVRVVAFYNRSACAAVAFLKGDPARDFPGGYVPRVLPDWCPLRAGNVEIALAETASP